MEKFLLVMGGVALFVFQLLLTMFTISTIWGWFIVPLGAPVIGMAQAYGISLILAYITVRSTPDFKTDILRTMSLSERVGKSIGINVGILLIGWVGTLFM